MHLMLNAHRLERRECYRENSIKKGKQESFQENWGGARLKEKFGESRTEGSIVKKCGSQRFA